ncbi:MAG: 30S ribosomal protein S2 [Bacteroidales bacterium]|jgi:small subunit ribosomal protein S2|nr:30S ribosomal protein S2 [Bacteroidales bacterium]MBO7179905.1 30S ribosomal protein S2 [Bacteroidales bacterium]MBO7228957.1 30S ribosomal protein S2 [Bacteroidales bacterium]MBQ2304233.1 30S ribosomal protein S2 [Bacteroidales bacterium]MEE0916851.1 30S ribosomal protein S2 [Bacteroidales bacterium]
MLEFNQMLDAGVHFGHLRRKWNPKMAPYIFMERNGIHIIDLHKTAAKVEEASAALKQIAKSGKKILFVATKKQAKDIVAERVKRTNMPFVTERWPGGMLTNFVTIRKAVKKMNSLERLLNDKESTAISKRERLQITREKAKLEKNLGSIAELTRLPSALFIVDVNKEHIAVAEAKRLNIPTFAMVDTNCDPDVVDFAIPANDDASKSVALIVDYVCQAIEEGMQERKMDKDSKVAEQEETENDRLATELLDDEVTEGKEENKIRKVKAVAEDNETKRPRRQVSKKSTSRK